MLSKLNINEIYRFKEISYSHQIVSNTYMNAKNKCYENPSNKRFTCINKWDKLANESKKKD